MHSTPPMAKKRALEMNAQWPGPRAIIERIFLLRQLHSTGQTFESRESFVDRRSDRGRKIAARAMLRQKAFDGRQSFRITLHHIVAGSAMDMNVDESGRQHGIPEINPAAARRQLSRSPGDDLNNDAVLNQNQRLIDLLQRRKQCLCGQSKHVGRLTTETSFYRKSSAWLSGWHHLLYLGLVNPLPPPLPRRGPRTILPGNNVRQRADGYGYSLRTIAATRKLKDEKFSTSKICAVGRGRTWEKLKPLPENVRHRQPPQVHPNWGA